MNSTHFLLIVIAILIGFWVRIKKAKENPKKNDQAQQFVSEDTTAKKCITAIQKNTLLSCLLNDEKIYGDGFKNKVLPPLPCCIGCKCQLIDFMVNSTAFSDNEIHLGHYRDTDLGPLSFLEFKYYKYSLIINQAEKVLNLDSSIEHSEEDGSAEHTVDENEDNKPLKSYSATLMSLEDLNEYTHMRDALTIKEDFKKRVYQHLYGESNEIG